MKSVQQEERTTTTIPSHSTAFDATFAPSRAWAIALGYAVVATLWIYISDQSLTFLATDSDEIVRWSLYKGIGFVLVTTLLLLLFIWYALAALEKAYRSVRASEERFRLLAQATNDAAWDLDIATGNRWWSDGFVRLVNLPSDPHELPADTWEQALHPEDGPRVKDELRRFIEQGDTQWATTYRLQRHDGQVRHVEDCGLLIRDAQGNAIRMVGGLTDITNRIALESQLLKAQRMEAIGQLTGGLAHDFNNLLTVILGNTQNLADTLDKHPDARCQVALIAQAAEKGADLTRRLLAFARQQNLAPQAVDLKRLIAELAPLLFRTLGNRIDILVGHDANLPAVRVDPSQLEHALLNLCVNARDAMPNGGHLTLATEVKDVRTSDAEGEPPSGRYVVLSVTDTGEGIPLSCISQIFEPFFTSKSEGKGSGLGLAMVYGFVRQSGGHITVTSQPGHTQFSLYLPIADTAAEAPVARPEAPITGGGETILLVEDNDLVQEFAQAQLTTLGYRVIAVDNGSQAIEVLQQEEHVDLLFTNVWAPGTDGRLLAQQAQDLQPNIKVLFTTGFSADYGEGSATVNPAGWPVLCKPYHLRDLDSSVRQALAMT